MNTHDAIRQAAAMSRMVLTSYVEDLDDADLMRRPGPGCNHLAWQLGHLVASECDLLNMVTPSAAPALPAGFAEKHTKETIEIDDPAKFHTKAEYLTLMETVHAASLAALDKLSAGDLDKPGPEAFAPMFPTVGSVFLLIATHPLMHAGQFVPVRRALSKPVKI